MAPLLRSGNPLRSEQNFDQEPHHSETEAKDHSPKLSTQSLATSEVNRKAKVSNVEAKNSFLWTLILSLSWLTEGSLQAAYRISLYSSGGTGHFNENYGGVALGTNESPYFLYNNYKRGDDTSECQIRAYSETGAIIGFVDSLVADGRGVLNPLSNIFLVLGSGIGMTVFNLQAAGLPAVAAFTFDSTYSKRFNFHGHDYADSITEKGTIYSFSIYYSALFPAAKFYRIDLFDLGNVLTSTLNSGMSMCLKLDVLDSQTLIGVGIGGMAYVRRTDLAFMRIVTNSLIGTYAVVEPTDNKIGYVSSFQASPELLLKFDTTTSVFTNLAAPLNIFNYAVNMIRLKNFKLLGMTLNTETSLRLVDVDSFALVLNAAVEGELSISSLRDGFTRGHHAYLSAVNPTRKRFEIFDMHANYCLVPWQNPCVRCLEGRYLSTTTTDNICWTKQEFPSRYGVSGLTIAVCLGDLALGCLSCVDDASKCTICDTANGFYLFPRDSTCLRVDNIPAGFGLNLNTLLIETCLSTNCDNCRANKSTCLSCSNGFFFRHPSDGFCYPNNVTGYGLITVLGSLRVTLCAVQNCGNCTTSYLNCVKCGDTFFPKEGTPTGCFANNLDGSGLKTVGLRQILSMCTDVNCKDCRNSNQVCLSCNSEWYVFEDKCYTGLSRMGPDPSGNLRTCGLANCERCDTNYLLCNECTVPYYFYETDTSVCVKNDRDHFGLDVTKTPPVITTCKVSNCKSCLPNDQECTDCEPSFYPTVENEQVCVTNASPGRGTVTDGSGRVFIEGCQDPNCAECYSTSKTCQVCETNYFIREGRESSNPACFQNNVPGFGLTAAVPPKITTCTPSNCADCFDDVQVCKACVANTYRSTMGPGCFTNTQKGYGLAVIAGSTVLDKCLTESCENCYSDYRTCKQCNNPFVLNPSKNECWTVPVSGMGKGVDSSGFTVLMNCTEPNCLSCADNYKVCTGCKSKWVLDQKTGKCEPEVIYNSSNPLTVKQPCYFDRKTNSFKLEFSEPLDPLSIDLLSVLELELRVKDTQDVIPGQDYSIVMKINSDGKLEGKLESSKIITLSRLAITQKNQSQVIFARGKKTVDPASTIYVEEVAFVPVSETLQSVSKASKAATTGLAVFSALSIGTSSTGGARLTTFIKVIEAIEYVLYVNGLRVTKADQFLYLFSYDPMSFIPNILDGGDSACDPGPNFSREGVSCSFLQNEGSEFTTLLAFTVLFCIFWLISRPVHAMKDSKLKSVFKGILYIPNKICGYGIVLASFDGAQITFMRSYLISLVNVTADSDGYQSLGLLLGTGLMGLYIYYGYSMWKYATHLRNKDEEGLQKLEYLKDIFEEFHSPTSSSVSGWRNDIYLLYPLFGLTKNFLAQLVLVLLQGGNLLQIWMLVALDAITLALCLSLRPFKSRLHAFHVIILCTVQFGISTCLLVLNLGGASFSPEQRESHFAYTLVAFYLTAILTAIIPLIYDGVMGIINKIKTPKPAKSLRPNTISSQSSVLFAKGGKQTVTSGGSPKSDSVGVTSTSVKNLNLISPRQRPVGPPKTKLRQLDLVTPKHGSTETPTSMRTMLANPALDSSPVKKKKLASSRMIFGFSHHILPPMSTPMALSLRQINEQPADQEYRFPNNSPVARDFASKHHKHHVHSKTTLKSDSPNTQLSPSHSMAMLSPKRPQRPAIGFMEMPMMLEKNNFLKK